MENMEGGVLRCSRQTEVVSVFVIHAISILTG